MSRVINASGAVVVRGDRDHREVLVVHRPSYKDWSLPKGKMLSDEYLAVTAVREVREETGHHIRLLRPLTTARYPINSHVKIVQWWVAELASDDVLDHDDETDLVEWWPAAKAIRELSYADDVKTTVEALRRPEHKPLFIVRHTKAMSRKKWQGDDADRRLTERGRRQAKALANLLAAFGVGELASSDSTRCMATLSPYAAKIGAEIKGYPALSEESAERHPKRVAKAMAELAKRSRDAATPLAVCGHRPVLPAMFNYFNVVPDHVLRPGEVAILYPGAGDGQTLYIPPKL